jgi:ApaG protein
MATPDKSDTLTHGIRVSAQAFFLPEQSDPAERKHFFGYAITIANESRKPVQLQSRHWVIIDGAGRREDVRGDGVVGQTPRIAPGESFKYQSFTRLKTNWGTMEGEYHMTTEDGDEFDVAIGRFYLAMPKPASVK